MLELELAKNDIIDCTLKFCRSELSLSLFIIYVYILLYHTISIYNPLKHLSIHSPILQLEFDLIHNYIYLPEQPSRSVWLRETRGL